MIELIVPITLMIIALLVGGGVIAFILISMRAHELTLYEVLGDGRSIENKYKMIEKMSKRSRELVWVSVPWQKRLWMEAPKTENANISSKGKKCAHAKLAKRHEQGMIEVEWLKPDITNELDFKPLSHSAKNTIRNEYIESHKERNVGFSVEKLAKFAFTAMLLVIVLTGVIMAPDIIGKVNKIQSQYLEWSENVKEIQARQAQMAKALGTDLSDSGLKVKLIQTAKPQQGGSVNVTEQGEE